MLMFHLVSEIRDVFLFDRIFDSLSHGKPLAILGDRKQQMIFATRF